MTYSAAIFQKTINAFRPACDILGNCYDSSSGIGTPETNIESAADLAERIATIITIIYGLIGMVFVGVVLWGVWKITTAGTNSEQKGEGFKIIQNAIAGLFGSFIVIILFAWMMIQLGFFDYTTFTEALFDSNVQI